MKNIISVLALILLSGCGSIDMISRIESALAPMRHYEYNFTYLNDRFCIGGNCRIDKEARNLRLDIIDLREDRRVKLAFETGKVSIDGRVIGNADSLEGAFDQLVREIAGTNQWAMGALALPCALLKKDGKRINFVDQYGINELHWGQYDLKHGNAVLGVRFYDSLDAKGTGFDLETGGYIDFAGLEPSINGRRISQLWLYGIKVRK